MGEHHPLRPQGRPVDGSLPSTPRRGELEARHAPVDGSLPSTPRRGELEARYAPVDGSLPSTPRCGGLEARHAPVIGRYWPLGVILLLFAAIGALYTLNTPILEGSDEPAHAEYVRLLASGQGLPLLNMQPGRIVNYEAHQPPLYYAAAAAATFWIDTHDAGKFGSENPHRIFDPFALTNRNMYLHTRAEAPPWGGATLAIHIARLVSLLFGAGALIATYGLAQTLYPARPEVWAGAAALVAFLPQFDFSAAVVSNDSAITCIVALALWQLARIATRLDARIRVYRRDCMLLGLLLGLAPLAKESGAALLPFALPVLLLPAWLRTGRRAALEAASIAGAVCLLTAGWWYVLRYNALGFWLGSSDSAGPRAVPLSIEGLLAQWQEIEISFWGLFGWNIVPLPQIVYDSLHWLSLLGLAGLALFAARRRTDWRELLPAAALLGWALLVLAAFLRWVSATGQPHGRLLFPALPAFAILVWLGLSQWCPKRLRPVATGGLAAALLLTSAWAGLSLLPAAYPQPNYVPASATIPNPVAANLSDRIELLGYEWQFRGDAERSVLAVVVYWKATAPIDRDYAVTVQAFAPDGLRVGQLDTYPVSGMHPTSDWQAGEIVRDEYPLELSAGAGRDLKVMVGMYDQATGKALQVIRADGTRAGRITINDVRWTESGK